MATSFYPFQFLFLLTISATLHKSSSYLCTSSAIINPAESKISQVRTSSGMFISKAKDPIVAGTEDKIATWTSLPKGEHLQIGFAQIDYFFFGTEGVISCYSLSYCLKMLLSVIEEPIKKLLVNVDRGEHRLATVLVYLTDVEKGGETVSPSAEVRQIPLCFSFHPDLYPNHYPRCPVIEGEKWSATKWIHVDSFDKNVEAGGNCTDQNESCERWAALGERTKNTEYTVGSPDLPGYCRRSSKVC
ncbi:hypothetical protein POPTR_010G027201v4 [Populus trichocarpa]|uniref:Uncharacterized protein n=1 Tax=Populus trichocarpa TaxID=3694 RepID=A0ACC0SB15_POPTR|nr:hypothetical protein POPTR_010G027201v4 [Populus trichocarpa]